MNPSELFAARTQMGLTLAFHIIFAALGVGMPVLLLIAEWKFIKTGDLLWKTLARRWAKAFAVLFAVGAVSGTVLAFELGLLWPEFLRRFGAVIGFPFTLEAFAFFLEAIFLGIYLYGWDRLSPRKHLLAGIPIAISGLASACFVVTANAWMNTPQGFRIENGEIVDPDPIAAMFNPAAGWQAIHLVLACYVMTGFVIASYYAFQILRKGNSPYFQKALGLSFALGAICAPLQIFAGDRISKMVAESQPVKLAAMEGQFETRSSAPLRIGGIPNEATQNTPYAIEIPGVLSWLAYGDFNATVRGLNEYPKEDWPPVAPVHISFQIMVGIGTWLFLLAAWGMISFWKRRRLPGGKAFLGALWISGPLAVLAMETGWMVTELGRQPWIVQGVMRTKDAVTPATGISWILLAHALVYLVLTIGTILVLRHLARTPLEEEKDGV